MTRLALAGALAFASFALTPFLAAQEKAKAPADPLKVAIARAHAEASPFVVSIRARLEISIGGRAREITNEILGTVVHEDGWVIASADALSSPDDSEIGREIKIEARELLVFREGSKTGRSAKIVEVDRDLGLAFLRVSKTKEDEASTPWKSVSLAKAPQLEAATEVGARLLIPERLGFEFGRASNIRLARATGKITRPKAAFITSGLATPGLVALDEKLRCVGFFGAIAPLRIEGGSTMPSAAESRVFLRPIDALRKKVATLTAAAKKTTSPPQPEKKKQG